MILAGACIERYYRQIDTQEISALMELFADDAVYIRAEAEYRGKPEICRFFTEDRKIRGIHALETILSLGSRVVAIGRFEGRSAAGDPRHVGFVDVWDFDARGLVERRRTFLAVGSEIVRA